MWQTQNLVIEPKIVEVNSLDIQVKSNTAAKLSQPKQSNYIPKNIISAPNQKMSYHKNYASS